MAITPCTQATLLICKKQERKLTLRERFRLRAHLKVCEFCRRFLEQTQIIANQTKKLVFGGGLTDEEKQAMREVLGSS